MAQAHQHQKVIIVDLRPFMKLLAKHLEWMENRDEYDIINFPQ